MKFVYVRWKMVAGMGMGEIISNISRNALTEHDPL